ncbi:hypothetical protein V492_06280 [Pseudogymnoascus sp. VKM F-4246]|nr:hypothetical protein V492_06280 [Pseudogymnoascus sp. VKM F-4246]
MRNTGSIVGGSINFYTNYKTSSAGGIAWSTYLIFVGFECTGLIWAFMLSPTSKVRHRDGSKAATSTDISWAAEFQALWLHLQNRKARPGSCSSPPSTPSSTAAPSAPTSPSTSASAHVRSPLSLRVRPRSISLGSSGPLTRASYCYDTDGRCVWEAHGSAAVVADAPHTSRWAEAYLPYLIIFTTGYLTQLSLYWLLSTFSTDVKSSARTGGLFRAFETLGQAVSYAINSNENADPRVALYVNCALLVGVVPCLVVLIGMVPERPVGFDDVEGPLLRREDTDEGVVGAGAGDLRKDV